MNIAKDVRNTRLVKNYVACGPSLIQAEIEALALEKRKHIVKKRIAVGKFYRCTYGNHQHVRLETFILLNQARPVSIHRRGKNGNCCPTNRSEPQHHIVRFSWLAFFAGHQCHIRSYGCILSACEDPTDNEPA